jgi:hypothetical protein
MNFEKDKPLARIWSAVIVKSPMLYGKNVHCPAVVLKKKIIC